MLENYVHRLLVSSQTSPEDATQPHNTQDTLQETDNSFQLVLCDHQWKILKSRIWRKNKSHRVGFLEHCSEQHFVHTLKSSKQHLYQCWFSTNRLNKERFVNKEQVELMSENIPQIDSCTKKQIFFGISDIKSIPKYRIHVLKCTAMKTCILSSEYTKSSQKRIHIDIHITISYPILLFERAKSLIRIMKLFVCDFKNIIWLLMLRNSSRHGKFLLELIK